jgi:hypothetical protein
MPKAKAPVQPLYSIADLGCGTPEHQEQLAKFMSTQTPEQVQTIKRFMAELKTKPAITGGYKKSFHYLTKWFENVPTAIKLT